MANVTEISRGGPSVAEQLKAQAGARIAKMVEGAQGLELTETAWWAIGQRWEIFALGPVQSFTPMGVPGPKPPGRIIFVGEKAYVTTVLWMNPMMVGMVGDVGLCFSLNYFTANTQAWKRVDALDHRHSIDPALMTPVYSDPVFGDFYVCVWEFQPQEPGCLYETNICARLCNCRDKIVRGYAGFVRWVYDFDYDAFFGSPGWEFNNPIRYLVVDPNGECGPCHQVDCD